MKSSSELHIMSDVNFATTSNTCIQQLQSGIILYQYHPTTLARTRVVLSLSDNNEYLNIKKMHLLRSNKTLQCM